MRKLLLPLALLVLFCACDPASPPSEQPPTANGQVSPPPTQETTTEQSPEEIEAGGQVVSFSEFNSEIADARENGESWTGSPLSIALEFVGAAMESREKAVHAKSLSGGESFNKVLVSVMEDGYLDDSLRGSMTILRMENNNGYWQITSAKKAWRCWEGRGHERYSSEPCN